MTITDRFAHHRAGPSQREIFDEIDIFPGDFHKMRAALYSLEKANDRAPGYMPTLKKNFDTMNKLDVLALCIYAARDDTAVF